MQLDTTCRLCQVGHDTRDHLFFYCTYARSVWDTLVKWVNLVWPTYQSWHANFQHVEQAGRGKSQQARLLKAIYAEFIFAI